MSNPQVELHIAGHGVITLELDQDKAPKSVANFLSYGTDVVDKIAAVKTGRKGFHDDVPQTDVVLEKAVALA